MYTVCTQYCYEVFELATLSLRLVDERTERSAERQKLERARFALARPDF